MADHTQLLVIVLLALGVLVSGGVWLLNEEVVPLTNRMANDIYDTQIRGRPARKRAGHAPARPCLVDICHTGSGGDPVARPGSDEPVRGIGAPPVGLTSLNSCMCLAST